jgi:transposase
MDIITREYKTINPDSICSFLNDMQSALSHKTNIHLMLDQGLYNKSEQTISKAKELGIKIHLLPTYSSNLNQIERLW